MKNKLLSIGQKILSKEDKEYILNTGKLPPEESEYFLLNLKSI